MLQITAAKQAGSQVHSGSLVLPTNDSSACEDVPWPSVRRPFFTLPVASENRAAATAAEAGEQELQD
jgi:hypothetical protein